MKTLHSQMLKKYLKQISNVVGVMAIGACAMAHGEAAKMLPLQQAMQSVGATVQQDQYANIYTISKNSTLVRAKPNSTTIMVNGKPLKISAPIIVKDGQAMASETLANEIFQSGLDHR